MNLIPPPPYSETDPGTAILTPTTSQADTSSLSTPSAASSVADEEAVLTPPYTPTESSHHQSLADLDHNSSTSATAYFETRPALGRPAPIPKVYTITITSTSKPEDIPYPDPALNDVTEQDWATFVNYLFPDHAASVNGEVADRKLEAEMAALRLGSDGRSRTDLSQLEAQLEPLRNSPQEAEPLCERLKKIDATITDWNTGFFEPRSYQIRFIEPEITFEDETRTVPGAWIPYDHEILEGTQPDERRGSRGFRFAGIEANSRGFRLGNLIRADNEGFRLAGDFLVSDSNGFRLGGARGLVADSTGVTLGGRIFGRRDDRDRDRDSEYGRGGIDGHHGHHGHRGRRGSHDHGRHRRRGRSSSTSSTSSSSSSSSSDSDQSIGSLPEYEDLKDQQLPTAKQSLLDWLNHPEQPITRDTVRNIKEEIKVAKKFNPRQDQDLKELRKEVRELYREFREAKRAQKIFRKRVRKEKHIARRAQKKQRRAARKEERRQRKGKYKEDAAPGGFTPAVPHMGHMAALHSIPAIPHMPMAPLARGRFPFGGRGRGPWGKGPPFGRSATGPPGMPGMAAMHGGWSFARGLSVPGFPVSDHAGMGGPISHTASNIHQQAQLLDAQAATKEAEALKLRAASTGRRVGEKEKLKKIDEALKLEEEAENHRREAVRMRAESAHLDGELAHDLIDDLDKDQVSGVIYH
jgi:hypothetical protein